MNRSILAAVLIVGLALSGAANAGKVYKIINPDGSVTYTDTPPADNQKTETLDLPPINEQTAVAPKAKQPDSAESDESEFSGYRELRIVAPENDATIPPGQETVQVRASLSPGLQPNHRLQLYFDGKPYGTASSSLDGILSALYRGSHTLQAAVLDPNGDQLIKSRPLTIHVKRGIRQAPAQSQSSN